MSEQSSPKGCFLLHRLAALSVTGEEAQDFLNRLLTNQIPPPNAAHGPLAALCTPKGRITALMRVLPTGDGYRLLIDHELAEETARKLTMYVLRSKVRVAVEDGVRVIGLTGTLEGPPQTVDDLRREDGLHVVRLRGETPRYLVAGADEAITAWIKRAGIPLHDDPSPWILAEIRAGVPHLGAAHRERFIPQMVDLDHLDGVSFTKGCYPGQEVVARARYRGTVKQRLYRIAGNGPPPAEGAEVRDAEDRLAGHIIMAAPTNGSTFEALASLRTEMAEAGNLRTEERPVRVYP